MSTGRPATRKVTPSNRAKRDEALESGMSLTVDGRTYTVRQGDLTAMDTAALRRECGYSFRGLIEAFQKDPDVDLVAAFVWLARRLEGDRGVSFEEVALQIGYDADIDVAEAKPEEPDPET